ncbi:hypothetical protein U1Q18_014627, partial [Sarracenia purpurea var. burkii]
DRFDRSVIAVEVCMSRAVRSCTSFKLYGPSAAQRVKVKGHAQDDVGESVGVPYGVVTLGNRDRDSEFSHSRDIFSSCNDYVSSLVTCFRSMCHARGVYCGAPPFESENLA